MTSALDLLKQEIEIATASHLEPYTDRISLSRHDHKLMRDPIFGFQRVRPYEVSIIDSPLFQRLRGIFQTSVAYLTYPSSIHTRFEHSLNCLYLADQVLTALEHNHSLEHNRPFVLEPTHRAETRLAALLHDIGHCIFSHTSELFYRNFPVIRDAREDPEFEGCKPQPGEVINYCIITSNSFLETLWTPIVKAFRDDFPFLETVSLESVARMIVGLCPNPNDCGRRYQADIINGPVDVDKLDYLARDSYFSGVSLSVDIDRLLPSFCLERRINTLTGKDENRLAVDHRGLAVVEQLLFARMILYDTVYHHHKVRSASALLLTILQTFSQTNDWPTRSGKLDSIGDLLDIDEYDFFGHTYTDPDLKMLVARLRDRDLPKRSLVLTPRALADQKSYDVWTNRLGNIRASVKDHPAAKEKANNWEKDMRTKIHSYAVEAGAVGLQEKDIMIDFPAPPGYDHIGEATIIRIVRGTADRLKQLFPFSKVVDMYVLNYKYRGYVFAPEAWRSHVSYATFRAFAEDNIRFNDIALIMAHQDSGVARDLLMKNSIDIPDWHIHSYSHAMDIEDVSHKTSSSLAVVKRE